MLMAENFHDTLAMLDAISFYAADPDKPHEKKCTDTQLARSLRDALRADYDALAAQRAEAERHRERGAFCLMEMMQAYERRVRSDCKTPEEIEKRPWECSEYIKAANYMRAVHPVIKSASDSADAVAMVNNRVATEHHGLTGAFKVRDELKAADAALPENVSGVKAGD